MPHVVLFDYGAGNLHSLAKGLEVGGARVTITPDWDEALAGDALVLPGVGSFGAAVRALDGHADRVRDALLAGLPCLGICLGMQLLFEGSEEGEGRGIGLLEGTVRRLRARIVPQMGWNDVETSDDPLFAGLHGPDPHGPGPHGSGFTAYYANSFVCEAVNPDDIIARSRYEEETFAAAVRQGRTWAVQFHPEKSSTPGLHLLRNFLAQVSP
jgi:imidazole glycerol-phosphate synthase subunit HisH